MLELLNTSERTLITAARSGNTCKLTQGPPIRALVLRKLILRIAHPSDEQEVQDFCLHGVLRWCIQGAVIEGRIDLSEARLREGGSLPSLEFAGCDLIGGFKANGAHIERLTFRSCRFFPERGRLEEGAGEFPPKSLQERVPISLRSTRINTDLRLLHLSPAKLIGIASIHEENTSVSNANSVPNAPEVANTSLPDEDALNQFAAEAEGSEELDTEGPLPASEQAESPFNFAQETTGDPAMSKEERSHPSGDSTLPLWVDATALRVGSVTLNEVVLQAPKSQEVAEDGFGRYALDLNSAVIDGSLWLQPRVVARGGIRIRSTRIAGDVWANGLEADDGETEETRQALLNPRSAFNAQGASIGGICALGATLPIGTEVSSSQRVRTPCQLNGKVTFRECTLRGSLFLEGLQVLGPFPLVLTGARIGGSILMTILELRFTRVLPKLPGGINVSESRIAGSLRLSGEIESLVTEGCTVGTETSVEGFLQLMDGRNSTFNGDFTMSSLVGIPQVFGVPPTPRSPFFGVIDLSGCLFRGRLDLAGLRFQDRQRFKLGKMIHNTERDHLILRGATMERTLTTYRSSITDQYEILFARSVPLKFARHVRVWEIGLRRNLPSTKGAAVDRRTTSLETWGAADKEYAVAIAMFLVNTKSKKRFPDKTAPSNKGASLVTGSPEILRRFVSSVTTDDEAFKDYIRFLAASSFSSDGGYSIAETEEDLPKSLKGRFEPFPINVLEGSGTFSPRVEALLRGSGQVDRVVFHFTDGRLVGGAVTGKIEDEKTSDALINETRLYDPPFRYGTDAERSDYSPLNSKSFAKSAVSRFLRQVPHWKSLISGGPARFEGTVVDLRNASCTTLEDCGGLSWSGASMRLESFLYKSVRSTPNDALEMARWRPDLRDRIFKELRRLSATRRFHLEEIARLCGKLDIRVNLTKEKFRGKRSFKKHREFIQVDVRRKLQTHPGVQALAEKHFNLMEEAEYEFTHEFSARSLLRASSRLRTSSNALQWGLRLAQSYRLRLADFLQHDGAGYEIATSDPLYARRVWLNQRDVRDPFKAQPYTQLASVYRANGDEESARDIEKEKIRLAAFHRVQDLRDRKPFFGGWLAAWNVIHSRFFGYGLGVSRAISTLVFFWILGVFTVCLIQHFNGFTASQWTVSTQIQYSEHIVPNATYNMPPSNAHEYAAGVAKLHKSCRHCSDLASSAPHPTETSRTVVELPTQYRMKLKFADAPCAASINPLLYAVETFTPLLNLHQSSRCELRSHAARYVWACYQGIGYIFTSLAVLTFSGVARRWEQK